MIYTLCKSCRSAEQFRCWWRHANYEWAIPSHAPPTPLISSHFYVSGSEWRFLWGFTFHRTWPAFTYLPWTVFTCKHPAASDARTLISRIIPFDDVVLTCVHPAFSFGTPDRALLQNCMLALKLFFFFSCILIWWKLLRECPDDCTVWRPIWLLEVLPERPRSASFRPFIQLLQQ